MHLPSLGSCWATGPSRRRKSKKDYSGFGFASLPDFENLFGSGAYKKILCHHSPANCPGRIDQELSQTGNVCPFCSLSGVNQIIAANCLEFSRPRFSTGKIV